MKVRLSKLIEEYGDCYVEQANENLILLKIDYDKEWSGHSYPEAGELYWYLDAVDYEPVMSIWTDSFEDKKRLHNMNAFPSLKVAEEEKKERQVKQSWLLRGGRNTFEQDRENWIIVYDPKLETYLVEKTNKYIVGTIYFDNKEMALEAICYYI